MDSDEILRDEEDEEMSFDTWIAAGRMIGANQDSSLERQAFLPMAQFC